MAKAKGKGKGKPFAPLPVAGPNTQKRYEGALDMSYYILARMKNSEWKKAKIIDCRLSKDYDSKQQKTEHSYDYYVHYENQNRRLDEWLTRERIKVTDEQILEEPKITKKTKIDKKEHQQENDEHEGMDHQSLIKHEMHTKVKTIENIEFGTHRTEAWYYSPLPSGYHSIDCLYICEFCLSFYVHKTELTRHQQKCLLTKLGHPPGDEIYRDTEKCISMFEVDGHKNPTYCENLCYISKFFLDHKNLYYDVEPFLFFILTEYNDTGFHMVGYFSKEKESTQGWNLSCILTFPFHQRKGYGKFLISMSYTLSLIEGKIGTPERPLSDLGRQSYLSWWTQTLIDYFRKYRDREITLAGITKETGIKESDILWTLEQKQLIKYQQSTPLLCMDMDYLSLIYDKAGRPGIPVKRELIHWVPYKKPKGLEKA